MATTNENRQVIIVGAGLAGSLAALLLARQGCDVHVYEQREDPTASGHEPPQQRSINLAISTRGLTALAKVGLDERVRQLGVPMHGRCVHSLDGGLDYQPYGQRGQYLLSVSRNSLNSLLIEECKKLGDKVHLHFSHKCEDVDYRLPAATFNGGVVATGDLLIGADGTWSKVRGALMKSYDFNYSQEFITSKYKEITLKSDVNMEKNWLHIWPRHKFMLIALPNNKGNEYTCTLFMEDVQFQGLNTEEKVVKFFKTNFPDIFDNLPEIGKQFLESPTPSLVTIKCQPYHVGKCVIIGDAAHSMVPFFGQGSQAAFEDARILSELIGEEEVGMKFTEMRKINADAISNLSMDNYLDMASNSANSGIVLRKKIGILMNRFFPARWIPLYTMISFSNIPYAEAVNRSKAQEKMAGKIVSATATVAITAGMSLGILWGVRRMSMSSK